MKFYKIIFLVISSCMFLQCQGKGGQKMENGSRISDSEKFALEYPLVGKDNIFLYRNAAETADILEKGRGIVYIGFKECPWCQRYAVFLHDVAREMELDKIYYCDIRDDRENNSEAYRRIVRILNGYLQYDDEGHPRVYVPDVSIVSRGRIITHDFETSKETSGYDKPEEYWNDERVNALKEKLRAGIDILKQLISRTCNTCS
jgi:predicted bacteriocin transport accessory protein